VAKKYSEGGEAAAKNDKQINIMTASASINIEEASNVAPRALAARA
jgi:hypothetical protein